jgi:hypothetical protein
VSESDADFATVVGTASVELVAVLLEARSVNNPDPAMVVPFIAINVGRTTALLMFTVPLPVVGISTDWEIPALTVVVPAR